MDFVNIQAQLASLTSQLSHIAEGTTMNTFPTFGYLNGNGYEWGSQGHNTSSSNLFSNTYNSDRSDHSSSMCWEPQPIQYEAYWQPSKQFYSEPMQPSQQAQPNSGSSKDYNQILAELVSLTQGSQNQAKKTQQEEYWQPYEEFDTTPMQPPQPPPQQFQSNSSMPMTCDEILDVLTSLTQGSQQEEYLPPSEELYHWPNEPSQPSQQSAQFNLGTSLDNDIFNKLLISLNQEVENRNKEMQNQAKKTGELEKQIGQIMEFMEQIQEQSELPNLTIVNSMGDVEITEAFTLENSMEVGDKPNASKQSQEEDEQLLIEAREESPLPQPLIAPKPSNSGKVDPNSVNSNPIPPNVPFPLRFMISKEEESEKDIVEALPKMQSDIPILDATIQVPNCVEVFKKPCTPRRKSQEKEMAGECQEFVKDDVFETTKPKEVEFDDTGQITTIVVNLAKFKVPETFKEVVFILEFMSEHTGKSLPRISSSFYIYKLLMIQAPTLEFKPLPDHFNYHLPFKKSIPCRGT